ncbi:hypothetical protein Leryth_019197 [Lithospermum erythrorhizon]|nr:hypothetical protein Leryth_019197 [Lithospermum erythrorhizon]
MSNNNSQAPSGSDPTHYWCYNCNKRVTIQTHSDQSNVVCFDCNNGFVESISPAPVESDFLTVLRLISEAAREHHPPPNNNHVEEDDDIQERGRILDRVDEIRDDEDDVEDDDYVNENIEDFGMGGRGDEILGVDQVNGNRDEEVDFGIGGRESLSLGDDIFRIGENRDGVDEEVDFGMGERGSLSLGDDEIRTRRVVEALRRTLIGEHSRGRRNEGLRRNRILDWAEILMGLEDHSIEMRLNVPEVDSYVGDPGDYVDAAGYEALLQNLVDSDNGGRRGAPPASKLAVEGLESRVVRSEEEVVLCAVCKELVNVGESGKVLPCEHLYHGECIVPWLEARNSCPICRFELPTDDPEYEEERKKKVDREKGSSSRGVGVGVDGDH